MADFGVGEAIALVGGVASAGTAIASATARKELTPQAPVVSPLQQKAIDPNATRRANLDDAFAGIPGTLLTGANGVSPNSLSTGRTVLGG